MRLGNKTLPSIYQILGLLLIVSIWAFNEEKYITYPIKIVFILVYGYYWLSTSRGTINKYQGWCLLMIIFSIMAVFYAQDTNVAVYTLINVLQVFLIAFVLSGYISKRDEVMKYLHYFLFGGVILMARLLVVTPLHVWVSFERLGEAIGYNANDVGNKAAIAAIIAICLFKNAKGKFKRYYGILFVLMSVLVLFSGSRKSLIAVAVAFFILYTIGLENKKNIFLSIVIICGIMFGVYQLILTNDVLYATMGRRIESMIAVFFHGASEASSIDLRKKYMALARDLVMQSPIFGIGLGNFQVLSGIGVYCHCDYLEVACSYGIPIAIAYYYPVITTLCRQLFFRKNDVMDYVFIIILLVLLINFFTMVMYISVYTQILICISISYWRIKTTENVC